MLNLLLRRLETEGFQDSVGFLLPAPALRRVLQHSQDVRNLTNGIRFGEIDEREIRAFVSGLMYHFRHGELFRHNLALAALAVAVEHWRGPFAEEYLLDLVRVQCV